MTRTFVRRIRWGGGLVAAASLLLLLPAAAVPGVTVLEAQLQDQRDLHSGMRFGVGYTPIFPHATLGGGLFVNFPAQRFGLFADAKFTNGTVQDDPSYCPPNTRPPNLDACTIENVEFRWPVDWLIQEISEFVVFNAGGYYSITDELAFMVGAGWVRRQDINEYSEVVPVEGEWRVYDTGKYYAPRWEEPQWGAQAVVGLLFRAGNRLAIRFGYETEPGGVSLGIYTVF